MEPTISAGTTGDETMESCGLSFTTEGCSGCGARREKIAKPTKTQTRGAEDQSQAPCSSDAPLRFGFHRIYQPHRPPRPGIGIAKTDVATHDFLLHTVF